MLNIFKKYLILFVLVLSILGCGVKKSMRFTPNLSSYLYTPSEINTINDSTITSKNNYLFKNKYGHWELKVTGNPLEIGLETGKLTKKLYLNFQFHKNLI